VKRKAPDSANGKEGRQASTGFEVGRLAKNLEVKDNGAMKTYIAIVERDADTGLLVG
jgi:hypothetical protein